MTITHLLQSMCSSRVLWCSTLLHLSCVGYVCIVVLDMHLVLLVLAALNVLAICLYCGV